MVFQELFATLWDLDIEMRQALAMRLLNYSGPVNYEVVADFPAEEKFNEVVSYLNSLEDKGERVRRMADLLASLVNNHRLWLYRTTSTS
jgi:hypothetical protein